MYLYLYIDIGNIIYCIVQLVALGRKRVEHH